jgi:hypothetical protein
MRVSASTAGAYSALEVVLVAFTSGAGILVGAVGAVGEGGAADTHLRGSIIVVSLLALVAGWFVTAGPTVNDAGIAKGAPRDGGCVAIVAIEAGVARVTFGASLAVCHSTRDTFGSVLERTLRTLLANWWVRALNAEAHAVSTGSELIYIGSLFALETHGSILSTFQTIRMNNIARNARCIIPEEAFGTTLANCTAVVRRRACLTFFNDRLTLLTFVFSTVKP